jgi:hypothetical protein
MRLVDKRPVARQARRSPTRREPRQGDHDVLEHRVVEQVHDLERARDAEPRDALRRQAGDRPAVEADLAAVGP